MDDVVARPGLIRRPRLEARLDAALGRRLTMLTTGPGYGKTTLLTQWLGDRLAVWHTLSPADRSLPFVVSSVAERVAQVVPGMSSDLQNAVAGMRGPETDTGGRSRADALAGVLAHELEEHLGEDLVLILDDVHHIRVNDHGARFLSALVRNAPSRLHIITASRRTLPFPTTRMQLTGHAEEISSEDLAFTEEELIRLLVLEGASSDLAGPIMEYTGGWPAAVVFAVKTAGRLAGAQMESWDQTDLFQYLAEEVISAESQKRVGILRRMAELPWVNQDLLARIGEPVANDSVMDLDRSTIYFMPVPGSPGGVSVLPLVRGFLLERFELAEAERDRLLLRAAEWYRERGAVEEAVRCLRSAGDDQMISDLLKEKGDQLLTAGHARLVVSTIKLLGEHDSDQLTLLEAEAHQQLGDWEAAMRCYQGLAPADGPIPAGVAWRLGFLHHMRGDVAGALEMYRRGVLDGNDQANEAALLGWMASAHWLRGERDQAKELADRALALAQAADDSRALATAHTVLAMVAALDGDRAANDIHYLRALEHAERARDVVQTMRVRSNRGSHFLEEGDFDSALAEIEAASRLAEMSGFEFWRAMSFSHRGQVLAYQGHLDEALAELEHAQRSFRRIGSAMEAYPLTHQGDLYATRGDTALALLCYEEAIRLGEEPADLQALVPALAGLARLIAAEDPDRAIELARRSAEVASVIGHVQALLAQAHVALATEDTGEALKQARRAVEEARSRRDLPGLAEALEVEAAACGRKDQALDLLRQARSVWSEIGAPVGKARVDMATANLKGGQEGLELAENAAVTLEKLGAKGMALEARETVRRLARAESHPLAIRVLGAFAVVVGGKPVATSAWQSRVAREIVGMMLANRGRPLHREVIQERLWPDDDPGRSGNRLSVALSTIRHVFDPDRAYPSDHYVTGDRESVSLNLANIDVDYETFMDEARSGEALIREGRREEGLALLRSAEARYLGDFLEEYPYTDWAIGPREEARSRYVSTAHALAEADREQGDHDSAARRYLRILQRDPYDEPAHLGVVAAMKAAGRHGTARRLYGTYVSRMTELDVEPEPFPVVEHDPPHAVPQRFSRIKRGL